MMSGSQGESTPNIGDTQQEVSENTLTYLIFTQDKSTDSRQVLRQLETVRQAALKLCSDLTADYIWQKDVFDLQLRTEGELVYLHGATDYGDAIEDEWLIVYILRELSVAHPNIWIRMFDSDGEFLLVEAANVLPKWLSPEIDHNRVWIQNGKLLIIPYHQDDSSTPRNLPLTVAVDFIKQQQSSLVHSEFIEAEAFYRLEKYPGQIADSIHHSVLRVPRKLAFVLHSLPKAVAPGVEAFYVRDALALKPILSPTATLTFPPDDIVTVSVRFSKVLFAQLRSQRFEPPPRWQSLMQKSNGGDDQASQSMEMGMKLTCGFEMLAANAAKSSNRTVRQLAIVLEDLQEDGPDALPSDTEIKSWSNVTRNDSEEWLDINYEDFERVLEGGSSGPSKPKFGDANAEENLKKIVSRFESFLNDDKAGLDGAEIDDMDVDDDTDDEFDSDETSNAEDKEVSFDEEEFAKMMREMMGLPSPDTGDKNAKTSKGKERAATIKQRQSMTNVEHEETDDDVEEIKKLTSQMEAELKGHGALKLGHGSKNGKQPKLKNEISNTGSSGSNFQKEGSEDDEDEDVDIDYNLASNILESFKSQGGMSGPTGNLLGAMGFQLPRDEDDGNEQQDKQSRK